MRTVAGLEVRQMKGKSWLERGQASLADDQWQWWTGPIQDAPRYSREFPKADRIFICSDDLPLVEAAFNTTSRTSA